MATARRPGTTGAGRAAEDRALAELLGAGLQLLERNFRCRFGEIDLVMRDGNTLVFVEVRLRHGERFGSAAESITVSKQRRLLAAASAYLSRHRVNGNIEARFDVIAFDGGPDPERGRMQWLRDAFH